MTVGFQLLKNLMALNVDETNANGRWRPWDFDDCADGRVSVEPGNFHLMKRPDASKEANTISLRPTRHSRCSTP